MLEVALSQELFQPRFDLWVGGIVKLSHDCEQCKHEVGILLMGLLWGKQISLVCS